MHDNKTSKLRIDLTDSGEYPFDRDLHPNLLAGDNYGVRDPLPDFTGWTAYDVKGAHQLLEAWQDDDLKQVPILPPGTRLKQGATYLDLRMPGSGEFSARADQEAGEDNWYVPKDLAPYTLWNRLIGVKST